MLQISKGIPLKFVCVNLGIPIPISNEERQATQLCSFYERIVNAVTTMQWRRPAWIIDLPLYFTILFYERFQESAIYFDNKNHDSKNDFMIHAICVLSVVFI